MGVQTDTLAVDLEARNLPRATETVNRFREVVKSADAELDKLGTGYKLNEALSTGVARANELRASLRETATATIGSNSGGVASFGRLANQANAEIRGLSAQLRQLQIDASRSTNPVSLAIIGREAESVSAKIDALDAKVKRVAAGRGLGTDELTAAARSGPSAGEIRYGRINLARQGADVFTQAGSGASPGLIAIQQGPQIIEAAAQAGLAVSAAGAAAAGAVALAGAAVILWSDRQRTSAERQLKLEEKLSAEYGRQQKAAFDLKNELFDLERARAAAAGDRGFAQQLSGASETELRELQRRLNDRIKQQSLFDFANIANGISPEERKRLDDDRQRLANQLLQVDSALDPSNLFKRQTDQANNSFAAFQRKYAAENEEKNKREAAARIKSVQDARTKVLELERTTVGVFDNLFERSGSNNPFVKIFLEGQKQAESFRIATASLSKELQDQGAAMIKNATDLAAFTARIEGRLSASDLRTDAARFRRGTSGAAESDADFAARTERALRGLGFDPNDFKDFTVQQRANFVATSQNIDFTAAAAAENRARISAALDRNGLSRFNGRFDPNGGGFLENDPAFDVANGRFNGVSLATLAQGAALNAKQRAGENETVQERLNRQLAILDGGGATTDAQRAEVNRRIIALTANLDPSQLDNRQNAAAASAREAEATRIEQNERAARDLLAESATASKAIAADMNKLLKIAETEGLTGTIRIINDAENNAKVSLGQRPNESAATSAMQP